MEWYTPVEINSSAWKIAPTDNILCIGSCFADNIGRKFEEALFSITCNPYGVMYNPISILHSLTRWLTDTTEQPDVVILTLGTNHVYRLKRTGEIVDNCKKQPQNWFQEEELSVADCAKALEEAIQQVKNRNANAKIVLTVSPIRYQKYGFHGSQLSKATLLLATHELVKAGTADYFPAYEIMNDALRDYRFYAEDMLHPTRQAVNYIWEAFSKAYFSAKTHDYLREWQPIKAALNHRPFDAESDAYKAFRAKAEEQKQALLKKWKG